MKHLTFGLLLGWLLWANSASAQVRAADVIPTTPKAGFVPNAATALRIAKAVWLPLYDKRGYGQRHPGRSVVVRNVAAQPFPHLEEAHLPAYFTPAEGRSAAQQEAVRHSDEAIAQVVAADVIVTGVPFDNFSIPSSLKAWLGPLTRAGVTFRIHRHRPGGADNGQEGVPGRGQRRRLFRRADAGR